MLSFYPILTNGRLDLISLLSTQNEIHFNQVLIPRVLVAVRVSAGTAPHLLSCVITYSAVIVCASHVFGIVSSCDKTLNAVHKAHIVLQ